MRLSERGEKEKGGIIASAQLIESLACSSSTSPFLPLSVSGLADTGHARSPGLSPLHQLANRYSSLSLGHSSTQLIHQHFLS